MFEMNNQENLFYKVLIEHGFHKYGKSMYRCAGQGIIQVINPCGQKNIVPNKNYTYERTVLFGVFSLYSWLPWRPLYAKSPRDLSVTLNPHCLLREGPRTFSGTKQEMDIMIQYGIPYFNKLHTHVQLANALEYFDQVTIGDVRLNDCNKIVPYILSGCPEKAVEAIAAIEKQNWDAYYANLKLVHNYDSLRHKEEIENRLLPFRLLKDAINKQDATSVRNILEENYSTNIDILAKFRIPVDVKCVANLDTLLF